MTRAQLTSNKREFIGSFLPVGRFGSYPGRLGEQFVIWWFRTGSQWRETPEWFGAWQTVCNRFVRWRGAGVFRTLLDRAVAEATRRGEIGMSLVSVDSTTARAHHGAAGMRVGGETRAAVEEAALQKGRVRATRRAGRRK
ncbi:transposase [Streptomyces chiangmaiensis]|uniref:Transposase n=1 Tax=Streptomyces chiangmaiensis TaxID=766497 RepID=A0ABU7FSU3_9ACTN|nr:transposase [Streptomyces chiangmaiensis]MED7827180.1 transposase [Streptomyces chiangmaiensis]